MPPFFLYWVTLGLLVAARIWLGPGRRRRDQRTGVLGYRATAESRGPDTQLPLDRSPVTAGNGAQRLNAHWLGIGTEQRQEQRAERYPEEANPVKYILAWIAGLVIGALLRFVQPVVKTSYETRAPAVNEATWIDVLFGPLVRDQWFEPSIQWITLWTAVVAGVWALRHLPQIRAYTSGSSRWWIGYAILWLVGLVVLLNWGSPVLSTVLPTAAGSELVRFVSLVPLTVVWSTGVFLLFLYHGSPNDGGFYDTYLAPFRPVLTSLAVILMAILVANYFAFLSVQDRVNGLNAARGLAGETIANLWESAGDVATQSGRQLQRIDTYRDGLVSLQSREFAEEERDEFMRHYHSLYLEPFMQESSQLALSANDVALQARTALSQIDLALQAEGGAAAPAPTSLWQIRNVVNQAMEAAERLPESANKIGPLVQQLQAVPPEERPHYLLLHDLETAVDVTESAARDTRVDAGVAGRSLGAVDVSELSMFQWVATLYTALVLFPWVLLLLFLYRKRDDRAVQIREDLKLLDGTDSLLRRALGADSTTGRQSTTKDEQVNTLIVRAFSNVEYVLSLILLTTLTAVGWYYVFYPEAALGLAELIRTGSGITELATYLGTNVTPLTFGFVGAYFFVSQMLLRRYLFLDLYPSAFLQAAERMIRVFILSLVVSFLASIANPDWIGPASAFAFFAGIFPREAQRFLAKRVNEMLRSRYSEEFDAEPLTQLDGINIWTESRLFEEDIENVQGMATVGIEALVVGTSYPAARIVDWVDQAILYIHCSPQSSLGKGLRDIGVRTASDLLDVCGLNLLDLKQLARRDFEPNAEKLAVAVTAVRDVMPAAGAPSMASIRNQLKELCDVLWPSPNLQYVLSYTSHVATRLSGVSPSEPTIEAVTNGRKGGRVHSAGVNA